MALLGLLMLALVAPSISAPLPQDVASSGVASDVVYQEADAVGAEQEVPEEPLGYQHQELNPADGSYKFGYENLESGEFRVEQRLGSGQLRGISGIRTPDGTVENAVRYSYDGYGYKQEPYTTDQVPGYLRSAAGADQFPQLIKDLQLFPEYFN